MPSHSPSAPQPETSVAAHIWRGLAAPAATFLQIPGDEESAQERQGPSQASLQQSPSVQKPLLQSVAAPQVCPIPFSPQLMVATVQVCPSAQSASAAQVALHRPLTQPKGLQLIAAPGWQVPRPSQVPARVRTAALQTAGVQSVLAAYIAQAPLPSQTPLSPQLVASVVRLFWHRPWGSLTPAATERQVPGEPT